MIANRKPSPINHREFKKFIKVSLSLSRRAACGGVALS